jgi:hypothetical protein
MIIERFPFCRTFASRSSASLSGFGRNANALQGKIAGIGEQGAIAADRRCRRGSGPAISAAADPEPRKMAEPVADAII